MRTILALCAFISSAYGAEIPACAPHDEMAAALQAQAKESPVGIGIAQDHSLLEVYASELGTWTVVQTDMASGQSCIKAFGSNWKSRAVPPKEQGAGR